MLSNCIECAVIIQHMCCNSAVNMQIILQSMCCKCAVVVQHMCCNSAVNSSDSCTEYVVKMCCNCTANCCHLEKLFFCRGKLIKMETPGPIFYHWLDSLLYSGIRRTITAQLQHICCTNTAHLQHQYISAQLQHNYSTITAHFSTITAHS